VFNDKSAAAKKIPRVLHVDAGLTKDHATLVMAHGEPIEIKVKDDEGKITPTYRYKVVVDVVLRWRPDKKKKLQVSLNNIETIIFQIAEVYNIVKISYDQWNSQSSLEMLQSRNIQAEMHTIRDPDYYELRSMMYQGAVDLLPQVYEADGKFYENKDAALLYHELLTLKNMNGRVDHPKDSSKDSADGLAGVNRLLNNPKEAVAVRRPMPKSTLGVGFTRATGMPFSPSQAGITQAIPDGFGIPKSPTPMTGQMTPSYMSMARSTATKSNIIPEAVVKGYATGMPAPMLAGSGKTPTATTKSMSTMMNRARMDVPAIHFK
jgi:hypothetical protein